MGVLLALVSALCYGSSDFAAGLGGRRGDPAAVAVVAQPFGLVAAAIAVVVLSGRSPTAGDLWWGALSGVGSGVGTVALYRGLTVASMSVVAPLSAVLSAAIPALTGLLIGERLAPLAWAGVVIALPAVALVSLAPASDSGSRKAGMVTGVIAGAGFALLFIGLDRAGTAAGGWPLLPGQAVALTLVSAWLVLPGNRPDRSAWAATWRAGTVTGVLGGVANIAYLAATGAAPLAVVAVVTALYPAMTVLLARFTLHERWSRLQALGLLVSAAAVAAISAG